MHGRKPELQCNDAGDGSGVLVEPTSSTTEAWTVTAGYDMVTGLGSVNVNNLATKWGTVSTVPTTTTLALSPTTGITHGTDENVAVNITVTPKSGTATGDVSLIAKLLERMVPRRGGWTSSRWARMEALVERLKACRAERTTR